MSKARKGRLRRVGFLVAGVSLALMLLVSVGAVPAFAADPGSGSGPLPSGIEPVVVLSGSDYNMGYQYSQQIIALIGPWYFQKTAGVYEPFSDAQITALKAYQWYIKQNYPELIDFMKGMADGSTAAGLPMTYPEALARTVGTRGFPGTEPPGSGSDTLPPAETCSVWSAWGKTTRDGRLIGCDSFDAGFGFQFVTIAFPATGNAYIAGNGLAMNNKGVWAGGSAGEGTRPIDRVSGYDMPLSMSSLMAKQHYLRSSDTAKQVLDFFLNTKLGASENRMFGDLNGNHYVLEYSAAFKSVRNPGDFGEGDFITMRNNYFSADGGQSNLGGNPGKFYPHGGWALNPPDGVADPGGDADVQMASVRTNQTMYNMMSEYRGSVDLPFMKMMWRFPGKMPKDPFSTAEYRATKARAWETPLNLNSEEVNICLPDNGNNGRVYVCTGPAGRVASPYEPGTADDYYQIGGTHTFYELALSATPAATVSDANYTARHDIALAYQQLMWKNYGDVGFEGLNSLYDAANSEYYDGVNWTSRAALATGNDKVLDQALAVTAFARAQCHAQQVYEALVRMPVTPSDLRLKPYVAYEYGF